MKTIYQIREIAKKINPSVYISVDGKFGDSCKLIAIRDNEWYTLVVQNLDSEDIEEKLYQLLNKFK